MCGKDMDPATMGSMLIRGTCRLCMQEAVPDAFTQRAAQLISRTPFSERMTVFEVGRCTLSASGETCGGSGDAGHSRVESASVFFSGDPQTKRAKQQKKQESGFPFGFAQSHQKGTIKNRRPQLLAVVDGLSPSNTHRS